MQKANRNSETLAILSPKPVRAGESILKTTITNPFDEISQPQRCVSCDQGLEELNSELSSILNSMGNFPTSKSLPSPLFAKFSERPPTRHKINPIIYDEKFVKFESCSTSSDEL